MYGSLRYFRFSFRRSILFFIVVLLWVVFFSLINVVKAHVDLFNGEIEKVFFSEQMQGAGFGRNTCALFEYVGDIITANGVEFDGILDSSIDFIRGIDFSQSHDFSYVRPGINSSLLQLFVIVFSSRPNGEKIF